MADQDPQNLEESGERGPDGRFLPGHKGLGGRPRRYDVIKCAQEHANAHKLDLHASIGAAVAKMLVQAADGDVAAFRAVADRLCGPVKQEHDHTTDGQPITGTGPVIPTGQRLDEIVADLVAIRKERIERNGTK